MTVNLQKFDTRKTQVINLKKKANIEHQKAQVVFAVDISYSMKNLYDNGTVQDTTERILPLGLAFDVDEAVDLFLFHQGVIEMKEQVTLKNIDGYVPKNIIGKHDYGGTNYAPVLNAILKKYGKFKKGGGFLGLGKSNTPEKLKHPIYVIFVTDGENSDKYETEEALKALSNHGIFVQFVGIGHEKFQFLMKLDDLSGRLIDNANFFKIEDIKKIADDALYALLMTEFPLWLVLARKHGLIE